MEAAGIEKPPGSNDGMSRAVNLLSFSPPVSQVVQPRRL